MAQVDYIKPVEALHGKLQKKDKVGFAQRRIEGTKYTFTHTQRKYTPTADQTAHTQKFGNVCSLTAARMKNPQTRAADMAAFRAQSKYLTLQSYIWHDVWNNYEEEAVDEDNG